MMGSMMGSMMSPIRRRASQRPPPREREGAECRASRMLSWTIWRGVECECGS